MIIDMGDQQPVFTIGNSFEFKPAGIICHGK